MNRIWIFMILIACPGLVFGQGNGLGSLGSLPYQVPAPVPAPVVGNSGYGNPQTAEGAALQGMAQVISAAGQYNLATSAAAVNMTQAQSSAINNDVQGVHAFWEMRGSFAVERAKEFGSRPTPEEYARRARAAAPRPTSQIDFASGVLFWPAALQDERFETQRGAAVDECAWGGRDTGRLEYADQKQVRENIDVMFARVEVADQVPLPPQEYVASRSFLQSLWYATTRSVLPASQGPKQEVAGTSHDVEIKAVRLPNL